MISELGNIKSDSLHLDATTSMLETRIKSVAKVANEGLGSQTRRSSQCHFPNVALEFASPPKDGSGECNEHEQLAQQFKSDINLLRKFAALIDRRVWKEFADLKKSFLLDKQQIEDVLQDKHGLQVKLQEACESNMLMVQKIQQLEKYVKELETVEVDHPEKGRKECDQSASGYFSPMKGDLKAMRDAFDINENIIFTLNQQLAEKASLVSKYEEFHVTLSNIIGGLIRTEPDGTLCQKLEHLCECVKQALLDNGLLCKKLEALQRLLQSANRENTLLNETVLSLNDHIDALSVHNDKLLHQFAKKREQEGMSPLLLSNASTPRSDIFEGFEKISLVPAVDMRASGDFCANHTETFTSDGAAVTPTVASALSPLPGKNEDMCPSCSVCCHCRKSEPSVKPFQDSNHMPTATGAEDDDSIEYVKNLKLMAKCLQELEKNSQDILASSLPLFNDPNFCLSSDNSGGITNWIDSALRMSTSDFANKYTSSKTLETDSEP